MICRSRFCHFATLAVMTLSATLAQASGYVWLERQPDGSARAYLGAIDGAHQPVAGLLGAQASLADGAALTVVAGKDHLAVAAPAAGKAGADLRLVTRELAASGELVWYQARMGRQETKAASDLELVPTQPGGNTFKLVWKGNTVAASQVNVTTSAGWLRTLKPAKDGSVTLDTPFPGRYVLELAAKLNGTITLDGKTYDDVLHVATLSFNVEK